MGWLSCVALSAVYMNAATIRSPLINYTSYFIVAACALFFYLINSKRRIYDVVIIFFLAFARLDLLFSAIVRFAFVAKEGVSRHLRNDLDIKIFCLFGFILIGSAAATGDYHYWPSLGFYGRLEIGFRHPNAQPAWALLVCYIAKHYYSTTAYKASIALFAVVILMSGSLGKILLLLTMLASPMIYKYRKLAFYTIITLVVITSYILLLSADAGVTLLVSGRNIIFQNLLEIQSLSNLYLPTDLSSLVHLSGIVSFFGDDFQITIPVDNLISATHAFGLIPVVFLMIASGAFNIHEDEKDFDRVLIFWVYGFAANPLTIWTPFFMLLMRVKN